MSFLASLLKMLPDAAAQGLIWGILAIGVFITYKLLDLSDLTVDGSFCTGGAVAALLILKAQKPVCALTDRFFSFVGGGAYPPVFMGMSPLRMRSSARSASSMRRSR